MKKKIHKFSGNSNPRNSSVWIFGIFLHTVSPIRSLFTNYLRNFQLRAALCGEFLGLISLSISSLELKVKVRIRQTQQGESQKSKVSTLQWVGNASEKSNSGHVQVKPGVLEATATPKPCFSAPYKIQHSKQNVFFGHSFRSLLGHFESYYVVFA